jgi:thiosulfate/3-mercaptopyruvate sulfurtransferase
MSRWLITVNELAQCYQRENVVVADCRFALADPGAGERQYGAGHIPGSHYLHLDRDLSAAKSVHGGRHPLPEPAALAAKLSAIGVRSEPPSLVVAYDDHRFAFASRLWWLLRYCGHDNVRALDGGYRAWCAAGLPVSTELPKSTPGHFVPALRPHMVLNIEQIKALRGSADTVLVDAREQRRFLGLEEPIDPVAGHIEGAVNFPWQEASSAEGFLLPEAEQSRRWGEVGAAENIAVYCGSGVTACVDLLALAQIGRDDAQLYAGSWSDWCSYPELVSS